MAFGLKDFEQLVEHCERSGTGFLASVFDGIARKSLVVAKASAARELSRWRT